MKKPVKKGRDEARREGGPTGSAPAAPPATPPPVAGPQTGVAHLPRPQPFKEGPGNQEPAREASGREGPGVRTLEAFARAGTSCRHGGMCSVIECGAGRGCRGSPGSEARTWSN